MPKRKVDKLALPGSLLDRLRARREAVEAGHPEKAPEAFQNPRKRKWSDLSVDGVVNNRKVTE